MGLFDTLHCEYTLPNPRHQELEYQTKDFECLLERYTITRDGRLMRHAGSEGWGPRLDRDIEWPLHGDIRMYTSVKSEDPSWIEYVVRFTHGVVEWIRPLEEVRQDPTVAKPVWDLPPELWGSGTQDEPVASTEAETPPQTKVEERPALSAEEALLQSLRREGGTLKSLLTECSEHWGYEDPVYRFYHQSFKVYGLQERTQVIVEKLQALAPDRPLNPWFVEIIEAGTGKKFKPEDNGRWMEVTRPMLEAFFHARFFLEMAVRYRDLEEPPQVLPSGYAALLHLFGLR